MAEVSLVDGRPQVHRIVCALDAGTLRVAQKDSGSWVVNQWVKKAVLLSFRLEDNVAIPGGGGMQFSGPIYITANSPEEFGEKVKNKYKGRGN